MKTFFFVFFFAVALPFLGEAHQIKSDKGVTVLLHVDPSDEPYSGTTTRMYLAFSAETGEFKPEDCDCVVYVGSYSTLDSVADTGTRMDIASMERVFGSPSFTYVFPEHDVYAVVLEGKPKEGATFEAFRIVYDLRVARGEELRVASLQDSPRGLLGHPYWRSGALAALIVGVLGAAYFLKRRSRRV